MDYTIPEIFPKHGIGGELAIKMISKLLREQSTNLGSALSLAHIDPPPPMVAIETSRLNAEYNQNLLHPALSPFTNEAERRVIGWIADAFQMYSGHMCAGTNGVAISAYKWFF